MFQLKESRHQSLTTLMFSSGIHRTAPLHGQRRRYLAFVGDSKTPQTLSNARSGFPMRLQRRVELRLVENAARQQKKANRRSVLTISRSSSLAE
ncbi:MAG: hypothetical protein ROO76_01705 [Terriglobia bacterium]|nr:hypothetical protein [Terriglobia bacterium]